MEPAVLALWIVISVLSTTVLWRFSTVLLRQIKIQEAANEIALVNAQEKLARAEQARDAGRLGGRPRERPRRRPKDDDEEDDEEEPSLLEKAIVQFGAGIGVDFNKAAEGDAVELQKSKMVFARLQELAKEGAFSSQGAAVGGGFM